MEYKNGRTYMNILGIKISILDRYCIIIPMFGFLALISSAIGYTMGTVSLYYVIIYPIFVLVFIFGIFAFLSLVTQKIIGKIGIICFEK